MREKNVIRDIVKFYEKYMQTGIVKFINDNVRKFY